MRRRSPLETRLHRRRRSWNRLSAVAAVLGALAAALLVPSCADEHGARRSSPPPVGFGVSFRSPAPGNSNVARTAFVYLGFTRPANGLTVNSSTVTLSTGGATVQSMVSFQSCNSVAVLEPSATLLPSTAYTVTVSSGILDENGSGIIPETFSFTTGSFTDVTRPSFAGAVDASQVGTSAVVTWASATDNADTSGLLVYDVFSTTMSGCYNFGLPVATTGPGALQATIQNVPSATPMFFVVRARDTSGNTDLNAHEVTLNAQSTTTSFLHDVWPIVSLHCQNCHTVGIGAQQVPNMIMSSPSATFLAWVNVDAWCNMLPPGSKRVLPGSSATSFVFQKISMSSPPCGQRMPLFSNPLTSSEIETFQTWIDAGAPNN